MISDKTMKIKGRIFFLIAFSFAALIFLQIPINVLAGAKVKFTLFDLLAPIAGSFAGTFYGITAVLIAQVVNILMHGGNFEKAAIIRLFPTLFAVWFFGLRTGKESSMSSILSFWGFGVSRRLQNLTKSNADSGRARMTVLNSIIFIVPALSIISFNLNPVGRSVWFYSLFWLVPYIVWPIRERFLIARSLGATMTAHAVGGAIWIWAFSLPATVWTSLIPIVIVERSIFALGISANYVLFNNIGAFLTSKKLLPKGITINKKYLVHSS